MSVTYDQASMDDTFMEDQVAWAAPSRLTTNSFWLRVHREYHEQEDCAVSNAEQAWVGVPPEAMEGDTIRVQQVMCHP